MKFKGANLRLDVASCHRLMLTSCEFLELRLPLDFDRKLRDFESTVILPITKAPFRSRSLLVQSLTHSSFLPEKIKDEGTGRGTYSPLAFLGDAVIALHARELVLDEVSGETSNSQSLGAMNVRYHALVSNEGLALAANRWKAKDLVLRRGPLPSKVLGDVVEAVTGAILVEFSREVARDFVLSCILTGHEDAPMVDDITRVCLILQDKVRATPNFVVENEKRPGEFSVALYMHDECLGTGTE